jgi:hypothetical protein
VQRNGDNNKMTITKFVPGVNTNFSSELNANNTAGWSVSLKNHIRTLIDRAGVYSADTTDLWGEAYIDADGRNDSVDTGASTTAIRLDFAVSQSGAELEAGNTTVAVGGTTTLSTFTLTLPAG